MARIHQQPWWGAPKNFNERKHNRKVSWLELFYDLVYVAAIAQLTHQLAAHPTWHEVANAFLLFTMIFWSWINGSQYYDLHGGDNIRTRLLTFWQMLGMAAIAITIHSFFEGHHQSLTLAFIFIQIMITYILWSVGFWDPSHRVFSRFYTTNYLIAFLLLIISYFLDYKYVAPVWIVVLLLNLSPGLIGARTIVKGMKERGQVFTASEAIIERFGLFTIIVLAESILGTVSGVAEIQHKEPVAWIAFFLGILISFLLWSIYFDLTSQRDTRTGYRYLQLLIFLHFPLLFAMSVVGACIKVLLEDMHTGVHGTVLWIFCIAMAVLLLMIVALTAVMEQEEGDLSYVRPTVKVLLAVTAIALLVPLFSKWLNTPIFLGIITLLLFIPVFSGVSFWIRYRYKKE